MYARFLRSAGVFWRKRASIVLIAFFLLGLCAGAIYAWRVVSSADTPITFVVGERATLYGLLITALLPLALSALFCYFSAPVLVLPVCHIKAFAFSFCSVCVLRTFEDPGWLIRSLLLFTDSFALLPLLWFWLRQIAGNSRTLRRDFLISFLAALTICVLDFLFVSPFLVTLF